MKYKPAPTPALECGAKSKDNYFCTRRKGHHGKHVAHIGQDRIVKTWKRMLMPNKTK